MPPKVVMQFLNYVTPSAKRFFAVGVFIMCLSPGGSAPAQVRAEERLFWAGLPGAASSWVTTPARWDAWDWAQAAAFSGAIAGLVQQDEQVYKSLRQEHPLLKASMPWVTQAGDGLWSALGVLSLWGGAELAGKSELAGTSAEAAEALIVVAAASLTLKYAFAAPRPSQGEDDRRLFDYNFDYGSPSFPSGHTMVAFSLAEVYGSEYGRWWTYPLAALVGWSRVYEGAHWPSDVLLGAVLGVSIGRNSVKLKSDRGAPGPLWGIDLRGDVPVVAIRSVF
jgi:membrane-associated phospholipid phosphatase